MCIYTVENKVKNSSGGVLDFTERTKIGVSGVKDTLHTDKIYCLFPLLPLLWPCKKYFQKYFKNTKKKIIFF